MINGVIFDIDGTLLDSFETNLEFFQKLFEATGYRPPTREDMKHLFHRPLRDVIKTVTELTDENEIQRIWELARDGDFKTKSPILAPHATEAITILSKKYPLAIATNRIKTYLFEPPLDTLQPFFKVAISYEDTEKHKPEPEPLLLAAERLHIPATECVYVGDAETDMKASLAAGMKFILYGKENSIRADAHAADLRDIPRLLENL